jgi:4-hydroxyacetophenone monooxygenase
MAACAKPPARNEDRRMNIEMPRKKLDLASAIAEGDIRVLLMVLVHMTGDERWLEPTYKPRRDVRLIPDPEAGLPRDVQDEIRAAIVKLFENGEPKPVISDPGDELMLRMMRATLGENVAPEYAPLMREEMAFIPRDARWTRPPSGEKLAQQHVLIVGAGVCAIACRSAGSAFPTPSSRRTPNSAAPGTSTATLVVASIPRTTPIPSHSGRGIPGRDISPSARSCSTISGR